MATYHSTAAGSDSSSLRKTFSKAWPSSSSSATSIPVGAWTWPQWGQTTSPPEVGSGRGCWQRSQRASIDALENPSAAGVEGSGRRRYLSQASSKGSRNHLKREEAQRLRHADADAVGAAREDGDLVVAGRETLLGDHQAGVAVAVPKRDADRGKARLAPVDPVDEFHARTEGTEASDWTGVAGRNLSQQKDVGRRGHGDRPGLSHDGPRGAGGHRPGRLCLQDVEVEDSIVALRPGRAPRPLRSLWSLRTHRSRRSRRSHLTALAFRSRLTLGPALAHRSLRSRLASLALLARLTFLATLALLTAEQPDLLLRRHAEAPDHEATGAGFQILRHLYAEEVVARLEDLQRPLAPCLVE